MVVLPSRYLVPYTDILYMIILYMIIIVHRMNLQTAHHCIRVTRHVGRDAHSKVCLLYNRFTVCMLFLPTNVQYSKQTP